MDDILAQAFPVERIVLSSLVCARLFRRQADDEHFPGGRPCSAHSVVFPQEPMWIQRENGGHRWRVGETEVPLQVRHKLFKSTFKSWESLCEEAAAFATEVGRDRLINISVTQPDAGGQGLIFVWYWE